jgi:NitT/TauT family transport system ATP-binding protein
VIELRDVSHDYSVENGASVTTTHALVHVDLTIPRLQFVSVVGPSGCGKTTLLRVLAGLIQPTAGDVLVDGVAVTGPGPERAVVFQDAGLFPWRSVRANIELGLELSGIARGADAEAIVERQLELMQLQEFAEQFPAQLSGGMRQRVGLARALAVAPPTLLMDEPFGALDAITRSRLGEELVRVWEQDQRTVVFVTHSLEEALLLSDRVIVMRGGVILRDVEVNLPRPRQPDALLEDPAFTALRRTLSELL